MNLKQILDSRSDEIRADIEQVNYASSLSEKKAIAAKYGISSARKDDIIDALLRLLRNERRKSSQFTVEDVRDFGKLSDYPEQYKKAVAYFSEEPRAFLEYYHRFLWDQLGKRHLQDKLDYTFGTGHVTYSDISLCNQYKAVDRYLKETTTEAVAAKEKETASIESILSALVPQMADFKKSFLAKVRANSEQFYAVIPSKIESFLNLYRKYEQKAKDRRAELNGNTYRDSLYREYSNFASDFWNSVSSLRGIVRKYPTSEGFVSNALDEAEHNFDLNTRSLAERLLAKGINPESLEVKHIDDDPKYFTMVVTDGERTLYARSIVAAEFSEKVTTHYRFIITERRPS